MLWAVLMLQQWDMDAVVGPPSACQRHVDLKNLTCSNVAKQLKGFRLEHFFCSAPFPHSLLFTPSLSVPNSIATHTNTYTHRQPSTLCLCLAHMKCRTWNMLFCPLAMREGRRENLHMCVCVSVCGVGVENVFWQVSLMRSFYEICKPGNPTPSPHLRLLVCHSTKFEACCWNCNWADCIGMSWVYESMGISMGYRECESVRAEEHGKWKRM